MLPWQLAQKWLQPREKVPASSSTGQECSIECNSAIKCENSTHQFSVSGSMNVESFLWSFKKAWAVLLQALSHFLASDTFQNGIVNETCSPNENAASQIQWKCNRELAVELEVRLVERAWTHGSNSCICVMITGNNACSKQRATGRRTLKPRILLHVLLELRSS